MRDKMDFVLGAPAIRYAFGEAIDFSNFVLDLAQIAWLVKTLMRCVFTIKMGLSVDCSGQIGSVVSQIAVGLEVDDSNDLLVELTGSVVQTAQRPNVSLVDFMVLNNVRIGHVGPIVSPDGSFVWRPACKAVDQHDRVVVRPFGLGQVIIASELVALLGLTVEAGFLPLVELQKQLIELPNHESKD